jgi:uncharacterized protein with NAD-binding domain and iron-sulfur cluster
VLFSLTAPGAAVELLVQLFEQPDFSLTAPGAVVELLVQVLGHCLTSPTAPGAGAWPFLVQVCEQEAAQLDFSPTAPGEATEFFWQQALLHSALHELAPTAPRLASEPFELAHPARATPIHSAATAKIDFMILGLLP